MGKIATSGADLARVAIDAPLNTNKTNYIGNKVNINKLGLLEIDFKVRLW